MNHKYSFTNSTTNYHKLTSMISYLLMFESMIEHLNSNCEMPTIVLIVDLLIFPVQFDLFISFTKQHTTNFIFSFAHQSPC